MRKRKPIEYDDFAIRIGASSQGGFEAIVLRAPSGGTGQASFEPPLGGALSGVLDGIARAVQGPGAARHLENAQAVVARPYDPALAGIALFTSLFHGEVQRLLDQSLPRRAGDDVRGMRLRLIIDPREPGCAAIAALPWELLYDPSGRGFLCMRSRTPVVRFLEVAAPHRVRTIRGPLRVLVVLASPEELPSLALDAERRAAEAWGESPGVEIEVVERATLDEVRTRLRRRTFHVLHFTGHGDFPIGEGRGVLFFEREDGRAEAIDGEHLASLLDRSPSVRLVVLNACFSGRIPRREGRDPYAGVAAALVRSGVPAVVAMQAPISDRAAIRFCRELYRSLAAGDAVDAAVAEGRFGIRREAPESLEWAAPVLHLRVTDGKLFERPPTDRRWLAAAVGAVLLTLVGTVAGWLWREPSRGRAGGETSDGRTAEERSEDQRPTVPPVEGCPPPPSLPNMAFVRIQAGRLELRQEKGGEGAEPRVLEVERSFCLGAFEVTSEELRTVLGTAADATDGSEGGDLPAGGVAWEDAHEFIDALNREVPGRGPFRLPTGEEWEYAARADTVSAYSFGDDPDALTQYGNCLSGGPPDDGYDDRPAPIGSFRPNPWGLYDVHGNVWEWVEEEPAPPETVDGRPERPPSGEKADDPPRRIKRGGSFENAAETCTSDGRSEVSGERRYRVNGFRLARGLESPPDAPTPPPDGP